MDIPIKTSKTPIAGTYNVHVDTPEWANQFDTGDLFEDIISYDDWLDERIKAGDHPIIDLLNELGSQLMDGNAVTLVCACHPTGWYRTCHGQMIVNTMKDAIRAAGKDNP